MSCTTTRSACPTGRGSRCGVPTAPGGRSCSCTGCPPTPGCGTAPRRRLAAAGHEVVAVDQRGHGRSEQVDGGYTTRAVRRRPRRAVRASSGWSASATPVVAGQSWGGNVVLHPRRRARRRRRRRAGRRRLDLAGRALPDASRQCWAELAPQVPQGLTLGRARATGSGVVRRLPAGGRRGAAGATSPRTPTGTLVAAADPRAPPARSCTRCGRSTRARCSRKVDGAGPDRGRGAGRRRRPPEGLGLAAALLPDVDRVPATSAPTTTCTPSSPTGWPPTCSPSPPRAEEVRR